MGTEVTPRTLIVTNDFPPRKGGVERFVFDLAERLPPERLRVVAPAHQSDAAFDRGLAFPVRRVRRPRALPTAELRRVIGDELRDHRPEVVLFGHALPQVGLASGLVRDAGVPFAMLTHGVEFWFAKMPGFRTVLRRACAGARIVFSISGYLAGPIDRALEDVPVAMLSPGVDTERFHPGADGAAWRARLGIGDAPIVLCVGRMVPRKGQDVLARSFAAVRRSVGDAVLVLVGGGPARARVEAIARDSEVAEAILFPGEVPDDDLPALYAAADVFAMPCRSRWAGLEVEGFGIVFLEAAAAAVPAIAGRSGGAAEAVVHGETGLVVDGTDDAEVVEAIVGLLRDRERAVAMGRRGRARAVEEYDWRRIVGRLADHLAAIADRP